MFGPNHNTAVMCHNESCMPEIVCESTNTKRQNTHIIQMTFVSVNKHTNLNLSATQVKTMCVLRVNKKCHYLPSHAPIVFLECDFGKLAECLPTLPLPNFHLSLVRTWGHGKQAFA